jgi:exonuclease III
LIGYQTKNQQINPRLNDTTDQEDLTDVYRIFHLTTAKYTIFSAAHGTFLKTDHILGHKASLSKYEKIEITPCILSDHNSIRQELNNKRNRRKYTNN